MISVSVCMIVKNESKVLKRCLDSLDGLYDELVILDTGSSDNTKEIAYTYTDKVYDFTWVNDFSKARNAAFERCSCDYIYSVDADEVLDEENRQKFLMLKQCLDPEIEIVQMYYTNQLENGTVYNFDKELRPKLFKRQRKFTWIEPVHETIREYPVVFDSDIEIQHKPENNHGSRDCGIFRSIIERGEVLSDRLFEFYARELFVSENIEEYLKAEDYFTEVSDDSNTDMDMLKTALCIVAKSAYIRKDYLKMYKYAMKDVASDPSSEICCILGDYYSEILSDYKEAAVWYYNAASECTPRLNIIYGKEYPVTRLRDLYQAMGMEDIALSYDEMLGGERQ